MPARATMAVPTAARASSPGGIARDTFIVARLNVNAPWDPVAVYEPGLGASATQGSARPLAELQSDRTPLGALATFDAGSKLGDGTSNGPSASATRPGASMRRTISAVVGATRALHKKTSTKHCSWTTVSPTCDSRELTAASDTPLRDGSSVRTTIDRGGTAEGGAVGGAGICTAVGGNVACSMSCRSIWPTSGGGASPEPEYSVGGVVGGGTGTTVTMTVLGAVCSPVTGLVQLKAIVCWPTVASSDAVKSVVHGVGAACLRRRDPTPPQVHVGSVKLSPKVTTYPTPKRLETRSRRLGWPPRWPAMWW
mmetsp:Transcript_2799/g.8390  ORF Transcript_2799/g.8390 Transcript_2799/m.8390 type:complete len:310 (+) Transcript_2799:1001-1930(+)